MARRSSITLLLILLAAATAPAAADEAGCAALAERVRDRVAAVARDTGLGLPAAAGGAAAGMASAVGGPYTCGTTAAVASRAFSDALRGLHVRVTWSDDWTRPGDACLSHYLDQCYPRHDRLSPLPPPSEFAFVERAWRSVARALGSQMPYGLAGDLSSFTDTSLDSALSAELRMTLGESLPREPVRDGALLPRR